MDRHGKKIGAYLSFFSYTQIYYMLHMQLYIYIYTRIYPPIKSKHIPLFKSFWSNQPISAHTPNNPVQFLVVKSLLSAQFESIFLTLSAHLFIQNFMLINSNSVLVYAILIGISEKRMPHFLMIKSIKSDFILVHVPFPFDRFVWTCPNIAYPQSTDESSHFPWNCHWGIPHHVSPFIDVERHMVSCSKNDLHSRWVFHIYVTLW